MLAVAYYAISVADVPPRVTTTLWKLGLFVVAVIGIAGFGHLLTDVFDVAEDRTSGRENAWDRMGWAQRVAVFAALIAASWLPWVLLPIGVVGLGLVAVEFLLFAVYAIPPVRLKERGLGGVVADGLYAHAVPVLVTWLAFSRAAAVATPWWLGALLGAWALAVGMRHLLQHQANDMERDRQAGVATYAVRHGRTRTLQLIVERLLPVEAVVFLGLVAVFGLREPLVAVGFVAYVMWETFKLRVLWLEPMYPFGRLELNDRADILGTRLSSRFYERWLPVLMLLGLVLRSPEYLVLLAVHLAVFTNGLGDLVRHDLPLALAHRRRAR